jgi:hypothetical protein
LSELQHEDKMPTYSCKTISQEQFDVTVEAEETVRDELGPRGARRDPHVNRRTPMCAGAQWPSAAS